MLHENFISNHISQDWFMNVLKSHKVTVEDVFYAVRGRHGQLYLDYYKDEIKHPIDVE
ncbi:hypothetical protein [Paenibacillus artemisiicola]|uniref:hypothetical protein n=1 Tax=Paenibacillus artemisiicola TaxID=1172618 RepID=UPI0030B88783